MEINELIKRYQEGDESVFNDIYKNSIALIRAALRKAAPLSQRTRYIENEDLFQEAQYYFLLALKRFDVNKGKWSTFLTSYVLFGVRSYMNYNKYLIRVPSTVYKWAYEYFRLYKENPDLDYISEKLGVPKSEIELYQFRTNPSTFSSTDESPLYADRPQEEDYYSYIELINSFNIKKLDKNERNMYEVYKAVGFEDVYTQVELSHLLGVKQSNIMKIKKRLKYRLLEEC